MTRKIRWKSTSLYEILIYTVKRHTYTAVDVAYTWHTTFLIKKKKV